MNLPDVARVLDPAPLAGQAVTDDATAVVVRRALVEHGISCFPDVTVTPGPQATRFALTLGPGVLPAKVERSIDAVTLATRRPAAYAGIRDGAVLVDVANRERRTVKLRGLVESSEALVRLGFVVGAGFDGVVTGRLADLPHLLVAGSTGGGKSNFLNALLLSLLLRNTPSDMRLILIDPKQVELAPYARLPHLSDRGIVTDTARAAGHLADLVESMEKRYTAMKEQGVRDWADFRGKNGKPVARQVVVVDELADLLMTNPEVEDHLVRLGQKGRAAGIHLVLATQRPDAKTITPKIKANIPGRVVFRVASHVDSKVALDRTGAERLTGHGDGLFLDPHAGPTPVRFQAPLVSDDEVARVVAHWVREDEPNRLAREQDARLAAQAARTQAAHEAQQAQEAQAAASDEAARARVVLGRNNELRLEQPPSARELAQAGYPPTPPPASWTAPSPLEPSAVGELREEEAAQRIATRVMEIVAAKLEALLEGKTS